MEHSNFLKKCPEVLVSMTKLTTSQPAPTMAAGYKTRSGYEQPVGARKHSAISFAAWKWFFFADKSASVNEPRQSCPIS